MLSRERRGSSTESSSSSRNRYYKVAKARFEYGEMNITKLNHKIDEIEDDIYREKMKIKKCSDQLDETFEDMINHF